MTFARILFFWLAVLALTGCATLTPQQRPDAPGMAVLEIPVTLDLVTVNGAAAERPLARGNPYYHTLEPGSYSIEVGYSEYWGSPLAGELVRSDFHKIDLTVRADTVYALQHSDPGSKQLVNQIRFAKEFSVWAIEQGSGQRSDGSFSRAYTGFLDIFNKGEQAGQPAQVSSVSDDAKVQGTGDSEALEQLKSWWRQASKQERADVLIWSTEAN